MGWWRRLPELVRDALGALPILLAFLVTEQIFGDGGSVTRATLVLLVMGLALAFRRRWPRVALFASLLTVAVAMTGLIFLAVASYTVVAHRARARPALVAAASALAAAMGFWRWRPTLTVEDVAGDLVFVLALAVLPVVLGRSVREARRWTSELESRNAELVTLREQAAEHAVQTERFRIAREMHDVVAHHVSAMTVRARAGHHVAARDPRAAADALAYIAEAGTQTLTAMGTFVGALRGQAPAGPKDLSRERGLGDIEDLLGSFRRSGLVVHSELPGPAPRVPPSVAMHTYRIVQEALTNVIRHGAADQAWVRVRLAGDRLQIRVDDDGQGVGEANCRTGQGLIGVAERVALHAGHSTFGPSPRGGCRLEATLHLGHDHGPRRESVEAPVVEP